MGTSMENILVANIYLSSMKYYDELKDICSQFFNNSKPAMTIIGSEIYEGLDIEIGIIAALK
jgi:enamine deaminase RidA (YjgF/YER057c/UK114 family)